MNVSWSECPACGGLIGDTARHADFHAALASRMGAGGEASGDAWSGDPVPVVAPLSEDEQGERDLDRAALDAIVALAGQAHADGEPWVQPTGASTAYRLGATATHAGRTWRSLTPFNVWEPPTAWREEVPVGYPDFVQPTGANDAYNLGDRVRFEGADYESTIDANVWSPSAYPAGWRKL